MTLYSYEVIFNPISTWVTATDYFVGNKVVNTTLSGLEYFQCILDHLSSSINEPGQVGTWMTFWVQIFPTDPNTDISSFVETIKEIEIGSGDVRSLALRLNANRGAFITQTNSGATPIVDQFDKISVDTTDRNGLSTFTVYEVVQIHPTLDGAIGTVLPVDLLGSEFYLQKTLFTDQFFFKSMFNTSKSIVDFYNLNKGTEQATIIGHDENSTSGGFNDLPKWTANDYTFNLNEITHYDGLLEVIDRGGSSVVAGGAGDFFELAFTNNSVNYDQINFRGFSSGNPSDQTSIPNIVNTLSVNPAEQEGEIDATIGNVVGTWCAESIGTLPRQNADFIGGLEAWQLFPEFVSGETYPEDAIILVINSAPDSQGDEFHYKTNKETSIAPPVPPVTSNADWDNYVFTQFLASEVGVAGQYSFWTNNRIREWKSNGANTSGDLQEDPPTTNSMAVWDSNQVKIDGVFLETWADVRALNEAGISDVFKRDGQVYRGFRVLVDGTGTDEFVGFDNKVIQWDGAQWLIFKDPTTEALVGIDDEALTYQFDTDVAGEWANISTSLDQSNDVYHPVYDIFLSQGLNDKDNGAGGTFGDVSAITFEYRMSITDPIVGFNSPTFYRQFAGASFRVPFPFNKNNNNDDVGALYGNNDSRLPATFEAENMGLTASGLSGFNNIEAEDLGPFDAFTFFIKHEWRYQQNGSGNLVFFVGNFSYRCALYDIDDTVVTQDFVVPFNNLWAPISLPINGFNTYKARAAWAFGNIAQNVFLQQLEILNSFRWRNIKKISIHWLGPYDDQGRFAPQFNITTLIPSIIDPGTLQPVGGYNIKVSIDSVQWAKPGLSISAPDTERALQPQFFYEPLITNKFQNDQANQAKLEITKFRHKQYEITSVGLNDLRYGDSFFLENAKLVNDEDRTVDDLDQWLTATDYILKDDVQNTNPTQTGFRCIQDHTSSVSNEPPNTEFWDVLPNPIPNTIKLVAKKIVRLIDKVPTGPGGFLRTLTGIRRFQEGEQ